MEIVDNRTRYRRGEYKITADKRQIIPLTWEMRDDWIIGSCQYNRRYYAVQAKLHMDNAYQGIKGGKIIKLWVKDHRANAVIFDYDRGFSIGKLEDVDTGLIKKLVYTIEHLASEMTHTEMFRFSSDWYETAKKSLNITF